ncbi:MAG: M48 family metalloprotease [Phormidium tanganyikae FI6-MK23]|jgi:Zn-dependent protease with chaperone function|nr:M48 family metalloprotease [Phormidium tanganyikae FI6-MK23]
MSSFPALDELEAGLTALQNGQTDDAIAQLTQFLTAQESDHPDALKAKMGLVRAYAQSGKSDDAIALCQSLQLNQHEKVRSWATQMMVKLVLVDSGFVPIDAPTQSIRRKRVEERSPEPAPIQPESIGAVQPEPTSPETPHVWRNAGRAQRWQPLPRISSTRLQWAKVGSAIALLSTLSLIWWVSGSIAWARFTVITRLLRWNAELPDQTIPVLQFGLSLLILFFASPWIMDAILKGLYGLKPLSTAVIARHSAETHRLIQRFSQQRKIPIPKLGILPTQTPIAFTYGCLPKFARIVVSQGLLDSLSEEEIAAIYASEFGHIAHWDFAWMSLIMVTLQLPYSIYRQCAIVSDRLRKFKFNHAFVSKLIEIAADVIVAISAIAYGFFRLFRWSGLWLSRQRIVYSDRYACDLTGNPNGLARALIKTTIATAQTIKYEKQTHDLLESFELFSPISYQNAILFEELFDRVSLSTLFQWDFANCDRSESVLNCSHPLTGTRLSKIMSYCQQWHLEPELEIEPAAQTKQKKNLLQFAPLFGSLTGITIAFLFWLIAHLLYVTGNFRLNWLASDYSLFPSFALIGFGIGTIVRFNRFFPESRNPQTDLIHLLTQPDLTLIESPVIRLEGTLIGRTGASNQLAQDLLLQTETGLIRLHHCSQFGAIGNLLSPIPIGQSAIVTGWLRRSATPWIDVDTIRTRSLLRSGHQTWSLIVAIGSILLGIAQIL